MVDFKKLLKETKAKDLADKIAGVAGTKTKGRRSIPKDYVPPPPLKDFPVPVADRLEIANLMDQHNAITEQQAVLKKRKLELTEAIKAMCIQYSLESFQTDGLQATRYKIETERISKDLMLKAGILPITIIKCTQVTTAVGLRVSPVGEPREDEDYEP